MTVEITQAMVEAGETVLCGMDLSSAREDYYAREVWRAMSNARCSEELSNDNDLRYCRSAEFRRLLRLVRDEGLLEELLSTEKTP